MTSRQEVRAICQIPRFEHVIGWCKADDGTVLAATGRGLHRGPSNWDYPRTHAPRTHALPWVQILQATWETPELVITWEDELTADQVRHETFRLPQPGDLPSAVQAMVTESVVTRQHVPLLDLPDEAGAQLVARRQPREPDAPVRWSVVFDSGLDPTDPQLREAADLALARARAALGI